jgi:hypothetical protein
MTARQITAKEMAKNAGIKPQQLRNALRKARLLWHNHYDRWTVAYGGKEYQDIARVARDLK